MPPFVARKRKLSDSPPPPRKRTVVTPPRAVHGSLSATRRTAPTLDVATKPGATVEENQAFLEAQADGTSDDESGEDKGSSDDDDEDEFEDVPGVRDVESDEDEEDEEEQDWEDALAPDEPFVSALPSALARPPQGDIVVTLEQGLQPDYETARTLLGKKGPTKKERRMRIAAHCLHVQFLLWHNFVRNAWLNDKQVQEILVGQLSEGCRKEVERWKKDVGLLPREAPTSDGKRTKNAAKGKASSSSKGKGKGNAKESSQAKSSRSQRDWGPASAHTEPAGTPNLSQGDPTLRLLKYLSTYWKKRFRITAPSLRKRGYIPLAAVRAEMKAYHADKSDIDRFGERIENLAAFREAARKCEGSRDLAAQLFTALLRGLGVEARLVASLQPLGFGWSKAEEGKIRTATSTAKKAARRPQAAPPDTTRPGKHETAAFGAPVKPITTPSKKDTTPRGSRMAPIDLDESSTSDLSDPPSDSDDSMLSLPPSQPAPPKNPYEQDPPYPTYWTEVISPITNAPIAVSTQSVGASPSLIASTTVGDFSAFEPRGKPAEKAKQVIAYMIAYASDNTAKDVTVRYLKRHMLPGKTKGFRMPVEKVPVRNKRGKVKRYEHYDWFKFAMSMYARPDNRRTTADRLEDEGDLVPFQLKKGTGKPGVEEIPQTLAGYKVSADYVLERHLRREEALLRTAKPVRTFKDEPVYLRKDVVTCKTVESWHKEGREVRVGEQPLKMVPARAVTLNRKREIEEQQRENAGQKLLQGLYAEFQTDWIVPDPIVDGRIPRNAFGNIDVYVPSMVPRGAVHLPLKGSAKICKKLGVNFAEACTGFEFGKQRAVPVLTGVVVAEENARLVRDAWREAEEIRKRKEEAKRVAAALHMWKRMLTGLKILARVKADYGAGAEEQEPESGGPSRRSEPEASTAEDMAGGFLPEGGVADDDPFAAAGGFLPPSNEEQEEEELEGGFMRDEDGTADTAYGGGFLLDHDDEEDEDRSDADSGRFRLERDDHDAPKAESALPDASIRTPISLQASRQNTSPGDPQDLDSETEAPGTTAVTNTKSAGRPSSRRGKTTSTPSTRGRQAATASARRRRGKSPTPSASSDPSDDPPHATDADERPARNEGEEAPTTVNVRRRPQRQAARKSATAVRSHYFASPDESESEAEEVVKASSSGRGRRGRPRRGGGGASVR